MRDSKLNLDKNALSRGCLLVLCFCVSVNLLGCEQTQPRGKMSAGTPLAVIATEPATPVVLGLGEKLVVVIHCDPPSLNPVQIWVRPYEKGSLVKGYTAHSLTTASKQNHNAEIVTGWFYFDGPTVIDEARVFMRDLSSREMIATHSYKIDAKWDGQSLTENTAAKKPHKCNHAKAAAKPKPTPCKSAKRVKAKSPCKKSASVPQKTKRPPADTTVYTMDIGDSPVLGAKDAAITIVEFGGFQCPYSAKEYPKIQNILKQYPDQVRFVFKHYPLRFHKKAPPAHAAAELARREKGAEAFWEMHDLITATPKKLEITDLRGYAEALNLDLQQFDTVMADPEKVKELLKADLAEAKKCKVRATPTILVNGLKMTNRSLEGYKARIDKILAGKK